MNNAIEQIAKELNVNWISVMLALKDRGLLTPVQERDIEDYFFEQEEKSQ